MAAKIKQQDLTDWINDKTHLWAFLDFLCEQMPFVIRRPHPLQLLQEEGVLEGLSLVHIYSWLKDRKRQSKRNSIFTAYLEMAMSQMR